YHPLRPPHPLPTRRSSDLRCGAGAQGAAGPRGPGRRCGSESRRCGFVTGLADRGDDLVGGGDGGVVIDLDTAGGELHADVLDALQAADLLLDLGHAGRAAEALGAEDGVGAGGGGGGHGGPSYRIVVLGGSSLDVSSIYEGSSYLDMTAINQPHSHLTCSSTPSVAPGRT